MTKPNKKEAERFHKAGLKFYELKDREQEEPLDFSTMREEILTAVEAAGILTSIGREKLIKLEDQRIFQPISRYDLENIGRTCFSVRDIYKAGFDVPFNGEMTFICALIQGIKLPFNRDAERGY